MAEADAGRAARGADEGAVPLPVAQLPVELVDELHAVGQVRLRLPGVPLVAEASPADQVLHFALLVLPLVNDLLDLQTRDCKEVKFSSGRCEVF